MKAARQSRRHRRILKIRLDAQEHERLLKMQTGLTFTQFYHEGYVDDPNDGTFDVVALLQRTKNKRLRVT